MIILLKTNIAVCFQFHLFVSSISSVICTLIWHCQFCLCLCAKLLSFPSTMFFIDKKKNQIKTNKQSFWQLF